LTFGPVELWTETRMPKTKKPIDSVRSFERALATPSGAHYVLRLFIAGATPRSILAVANIRAICEECLAGRYDLEVIDIYQQPQRAKPAQIVVAPTLIKSLPAPVRRIIGDLSNRNRVLAGLEIERR
jgi:circadian clock protein KaiB